MSEALLIKKFFFPQTLHEKPEGHRLVPPNYTLPISVIKYGLKFLSSEEKKKHQNFCKQSFNERRYQFVPSDGYLILE